MGFTAPTDFARSSKNPQASWRARALASWRAIRAHPGAVTLVVFAVYAASIWLSFGVQHQNPRALATIGTYFIQKGGAASPLLQRDLRLSQPAGVYGYDGQFSYFIAMDPLHAAPYIDDPSYRYQRILYPLAARALALGDPARIPYTLVIVNALAMVAGSLAIALWLRRRGVTPWIALIFGLFPGLFFAFRHDLTEPLGFAFLAWGVLALDWPRSRGRLVAAAACFALATLSREVTLLISAPYALALAWPEITKLAWRDWAAIRPGVVRAAAVLAGSVGPFLLWKIALLGILGPSGFAGAAYLPFSAPFAGLLSYWSQITTAPIVTQVYFIAVPGAIAATAAILALLRRPGGWQTATIALALNALYLCVFLPRDSYFDYSSSGRIQSGIVLAAILALPVFDRLWRQSRGWFWAASALWLAPLWQFGLQPILQGYLQYLHHILA
ncbi:MAG TPA: hypothetical protein VFQ25_16575 [Ktedonobacterales bacterium]|nr:hypothetical protein [Ktedonobacterales bacterium]